MERTPPNPENETSTAAPITTELLDVLPPAREAAGLITALLADQTREDYFNALSESRDISPETARAIAYNLIAHAPDGATTDRLEHYVRTGEGEHEALRKEYLRLCKHLRMPAEGHLLLDALGTHLFHREHPSALPAPTHAYALDGGLFYGDSGDGRRVAVAFQFPMGLAVDELQPLATWLERHVRRYGDPFLAFLRLPGIDAMNPRLVHDYLAAHAIGDEADELLTQGRDAAPTWDAVEIGGRLHVFTR